jgi:hypothetical protein
MTQHSPPAGWYEHPGGGIRWWDGAAWTAHTHDGPVPTPAAPSAPLAPAAPIAPAAPLGMGALPPTAFPPAPSTASTTFQPAATTLTAPAPGDWGFGAPEPASAGGPVPYSGHATSSSGRGRVWVLGVLGLVAVLLAGYWFMALRPGAEEPAAATGAGAKPAAAAPAPAKAAKPWAPKGWKQVAGGVAWKKSATVSKDCEINTACVKIAVMTKAACPMVRVEVAFRDAARAELSTSVAYAKKLQPKKYKVVRVSSPNAEEARYATLTSVRCMDAA